MAKKPKFSFIPVVTANANKVANANQIRLTTVRDIKVSKLMTRVSL